MSLPGVVAQPPFLMIARRSQDEETLLNSSCISLVPEFFNHDWRQHVNHCSLSSLFCHSLGRLGSAAERPSER